MNPVFVIWINSVCEGGESITEKQNTAKRQLLYRSLNFLSVKGHCKTTSLILSGCNHAFYSPTFANKPACSWLGGCFLSCFFLLLFLFFLFLTIKSQMCINNQSPASGCLPSSHSSNYQTAPGCECVQLRDQEISFYCQNASSTIHNHLQMSPAVN